ncbi:uncharacterized protein LOC117824630 [Xyrichtys novacula]|uniref:Uncharacterized protein LOC117824630 n=1 Tax=Xyrichtys novacula TaxID=13765 RepID=A0AAV1HAM7_XYRNO|nr:uncharacterized protein LOC117824630 [Xyrichtys novacula]
MSQGNQEVFRSWLLTEANRNQRRSGSEQELHRTRGGPAVVSGHGTRIQRAEFPADVQQILVKTENPSEQQDWSCSLDQEDRLTLHIIEEEEKLQRLSCVPGKSEDDEEEPQSSQLDSGLINQLEIGSEGEDWEGPESVRPSDPETCVQAEIEVQIEDSSGAETDDSDDWQKPVEDHVGSNSVENVQEKRSKTKAEVKSFDCPQCNKTYKNKHHFTTHLRSHTGEKPFICSQCFKRFTQKGTLMVHMRIHTGLKLFGCPVCGKKFNQKINLARHSTVHTGERCFGCSECGKRFTQKSTLTVHMRIHTREKTFSCSECGKGFHQRSNLKTHMAQHREEKPFSCSECGRSFSHKNSLTEHVMTHLGEKPFTCLECGKTFHYKRSMTRHMRFHKEEKSHSCLQCGKKFIRHSHLTDHIRIHSGEKPFSCSECGKRFTYKRSLIRHIKIHSDQSPPDSLGVIQDLRQDSEEFYQTWSSDPERFHN